MRIVRVYSGDDGESHFEDLTPDQLADIVFPIGNGDITLGRRPSSTSTAIFIPPPARCCGDWRTAYARAPC